MPWIIENHESIVLPVATIVYYPQRIQNQTNFRWFTKVTLYLENSELDLAALFDAASTRFGVCIQHFRQVEEDSGLVRRFVISIAVTLDETVGALDDGDNTCK